MSTPFDFSQLPLSEPTIGALNAPGSPQAVAAILAVTPMASPAGSAFPGNVLIGAAKGLDFVAGAAATPGGEGNQYIEFRDDGSYPQTSTALQVSSDASGRGSAEIRVNKLVFVRNPYTEQFGIGQGQADWMASPTCRLFAANANLKLAVDNSPSGRAGILSFQGTRGMGFSATGSGTIEFNPWPQKYSTPPLILEPTASDPTKPYPLPGTLTFHGDAGSTSGGTIVLDCPGYQADGYTPAKKQELQLQVLNPGILLRKVVTSTLPHSEIQPIGTLVAIKYTGSTGPGPFVGLAVKTGSGITDWKYLAFDLVGTLT